MAYTRAYIQKLFDIGRTGNAKAYQVAINSMVKFVGRESVDISEITVKFLNDWIRWIGEQPARKNCKREVGRKAYIWQK